jgi:dihydropteroate synthase
VAEEIARVAPVIEALNEIGCRTSIDTYHAETARRALAAGATMVNDIRGLRGDPAMAEMVGESGAECVIMHMLGNPRTMQDNPVYKDVVGDIRSFFEAQISVAERGGVDPSRIWLDPGFGFGKTVDHNLELLRRLEELTDLGYPILVGTSNKSTIGAILDLAVDDRLEGTAATVALAIRHGASMVRVHDVKPMARVVRMTDAILGKGARG